MNEVEIKHLLDTLSEYQAHRDLLEADKRALLEDVRVPEEVQAIVATGMKQLCEVEERYKPNIDILSEEVTEKLSKVVIPPSIEAALAAIDKERAAVQQYRAFGLVKINGLINDDKRKIQDEINAQTADVYKALAQRKAEIEAEFAGKAEAVDENIRKLTDEIKAAVRELGCSVKADHYQAVYVRGRITWNTDKMEAWLNDHPFLKDARKEGEPSVTLRRI